MKHFTQATANGLCTPPCGSSHGNLSSFRFRNSILMLFLLLIVGTNAAWGWEVRGRGLTGLTVGSGTWAGDNNYVTMTDAGNNLYYALFRNQAARNDNEYRYKICPDWKGTGNYDASKGNVNIVTAEETQISFTLPYASDVYIFYDSSTDKTWTIAVPVNASNYSGSKEIRQDLGLDADGWRNKNKGGVKFTSSSAYAKLVTAFVIPKGMQWRYEIYDGDTRKVSKTTISASNSATRLALVVWDGSSSSAAVTMMPYVQKKSGWKLFVDGTEQGTVDSNGDYTVNDLSAASHTFYFTNGEGTTYHGVNYFGGCYVNTSISSSLFSNHQYYKEKAVGTFTVPTIDTKGNNDNSDYYMFPEGKFTLTGGAKDVTFNFDGGVITINAVDHVEAFSGDFYVYGAGSNAQNWVTGWSSTEQGGGKANPANHMTITNNVARKTYYSVKGDNLEFKVSNGTNDVGTWSNYSTSKQSGVSAAANNQNIRFSLSNASDVTVCYDGTNVWLEVKERQKPNDAWRVTGTFNSWSKDNAQMSDDATNRCKKVTLTNVTKAYDKNGHGWIKFKIFKGTDWTDNINKDNATIIGLDGTEIGTVSDDNESDEHRILVQVDAASDITFCYYTYSDGTNIVTIKRTAYVAPVVSGIDYDGTEYIFMDRRQMGFSENIAMSDATCWIEFSNGSESAGTQYAAFMSDDNTLASLAPAGTWTKVRVARGGQDAFTTEWGTSGWLDIDTKEKNYITQNIGGWSTYTFPNSRFFVATPQDINNPTGSWNWNGDGTLRTNSYTKTLAANELFIFKLTRDYTRARANVRWSMEGNYTHYNSSSSNLSNTECSNINNNQIKVQLDRKADVTITWENYDKIVITKTPYYNVTFDSDGGSAMDAQELRSGENATNPGTPERGSGYTFNFWKLRGESSAYNFSTPVTSDIELVADWTAPTMYTVTFNTDGGSTIDEVQVAEGTPFAQPADPTKDGYTFVKWQLNGSTYNFESPVMGDIELVAVWSFKAIESVSLNKSTLILYEKSDPQTLTPSYLQADVLGVTYSWSVYPAGVVNVVNGVVSVVAHGTATITCTATDAESNSQNATCSVTVYEGEGCEMEEQSIFSHVIFGNSTTGGSASNNLLDQAALNPGMESTCRKIKMYYDGVTSEFTADEGGVVKAKSGLSDHSDEWYEIKGGTNANSYDDNFYYLKNVVTGGYITRGEGEYGNNSDWNYYTTITTPTNKKTNLYQFIYTKKDNQDSQKRICSVWNYNGTGSDQTYGLHRKNRDWADFYSAHCPSPMIVFGHGVHQGGGVLNVNFTVVATGVANPDYLSTPIVYDTRSYYRFSADAAVSLTLDKKLRAEDKVVVYCYNPSNAASNGALYINNNKVSDIQITANSALAFEYVAVDGDAGVNTIEVKSDDSNFCMASIEVLRSLPVIDQDPALTWSAPATHYTTVAAGSFTYVASSAKSSGAISYTSSNETVATVATDGTVTPLTIGTTTITASIEQYLCFGERSISYDVEVELPLQDAIDANSSLTLTHDYAEDAVINKAITIDGAGHAIRNLTVQMAGDLTLSGALTVKDFSIYGKAGNSSVHATSGQVRNATNLTANGNAYFYYTIEPGEHVQHGWYDFTVPFRVNTGSGIKGIQDAVLKADFAYGTDYAIIEHLGDKQAAGEYAYKKFQGVMDPCRLYSITLDDDYNYKTLRFQKTNDGALVAADAVTLNAYTGDGTHQNWNGVGNGTLHHANVGVSAEVIQVYQSGNNSFMAVTASSTSLAIGTAFMVQEAGTMTLGQATNALLSPRRAASVQQLTAIQIASEGQPFSDQLFISADETAGQGYTQGADVAKAGNIGNVNVPQIWTNAYNSKLCAHEAQLINGEAQYDLSLYAPANGTYTLTSMNIPDGYTLYLTQNGNRIWDLSESYVLDLTKGTATEYGLLLVENYNAPTGVEQVQGDKVQGTKVLRNGILYILRNGKVFNAQGARVE